MAQQNGPNDSTNGQTGSTTAYSWLPAGQSGTARGKLDGEVAGHARHYVKHLLRTSPWQVGRVGGDPREDIMRMLRAENGPVKCISLTEK